MSHHDLGASGPGVVVLELGAGTGALVLYTGPDRLGDEVEISPAGGGARTHAAVRERRMPGRTIYCAVYPSLPAGPYTVWCGQTPVTVPIEPGTITEHRL